MNGHTADAAQDYAFVREKMVELKPTNEVPSGAGNTLGATWMELAPMPSKPTTQTCAVDSCDRLAVTRGWCSKHYKRWWKHGDVMAGERGDLEDRFWSKVDKTSDCWLWTGGLDTHGYGQFDVKGRTVRAHRTSYELHNGPIPDGRHVCHHCDTPACVNPDHLFLGSHQSNMLDMAVKERSPDRILAADDVRMIRRLYESGVGTQKEIAAMYEVSRPTVTALIARRTWRHVE